MRRLPQYQSILSRKAITMDYANEAYYNNDYLCGKEAVITTAFAYYARKATQYIKQYTFGKITSDNITDDVKMCCCEIAELIYIDELNNTNGITSSTVGDVSESYESAENKQLLLNKKIRSCVVSWLTGTGLLYCGVK